MSFTPIGTVRCSVTEEIDHGWGGITSEIVLEEALAPGLQGLEQFSHTIIIYHMHQARFNPATDLQRRPRGRADMPLLGIFAQRPKHHTNSIGITAVEIVEVSGNVLKVKGLDAIDGTAMF
jgi:tRNA (Thr-GGU) A37 N-methylase